MKNIKKFLSVLLAMVILLGAAPITGLTELTANAAIVCEVGDLIAFGSYPQSKVTDSATLSALNAKSLSWKSYGYYSGTGSYGTMTASDYMKYADVTYNGEKYRAVKFTEYRPYWTCGENDDGTSYQENNGYYTNTTYWFKYDPIYWRVLDPNDGLILCETIVDSQPYSNTIYYANSNYWNNSSYTNYANDYATSSIREWLNDDFYNTAFTSNQKSKIKTTELDNSAYSSSYSKYDSETTNDKVFLLSWDDVLNTTYGFNSSNSAYDTARREQGSDYAKCQGLYVCTGSSSAYYGNSYWRLRSPGSLSDSACGVGYDGDVYSSYGVNNTYYGVRPALKISHLESSEASSNEFDFTWNCGSEDYINKCYYDNSYFAMDADDFQFSLATTSLCFAMSAYGSSQTGYAEKSTNAKEFLKSVGVPENDIAVSEEFKVKPTSDSIASIVGSKKISQNGESYTLIALAVRGGGYEEEWASNFTIGTQGQHNGFNSAKNTVLNFLKKYISDKNITGNVKFWITGFSRGGAVANLLGGELDKSAKINSNISYGMEDIYCYTFATPAGALKSENVKADKYKNIFNILNSNDVVPMVAPEDLGFTRYGNDLYLPASEYSGKNYKSLKNAMLSVYNNLDVVKNYSKHKYITDSFKMKKISVNNWLPGGKDINLTIDNDTKNNFSQSYFLREFISTVSKERLKSRSNYVKYFQSIIREIFSLLYGELDDEKISEVVDYVIDEIVENKGSLIAKIMFGNVMGAYETLAGYVEKGLDKAGIENYDKNTVKIGVQNIITLVSDYIVLHPNYSVTLYSNLSGITLTHHAEMYYAWLVSMDSNYNPNAKPYLYDGSFRKVTVNCEVDVFVYDESGNLIASIVNDEVDVDDDSGIMLGINEDGEKVAVLPSDSEYDVEIIAREDDLVNVGINEYSALDGDYTNAINYFDVEMLGGETITVNAPAYSNETAESLSDGSDTEYALTDDSYNKIEPDSELKGEQATEAYFTVNASSADESRGIVTGSGARQVGSFAQVEAYSNDNSVFEGWYIDGVKVSDAITYRFRVEKNVDIQARFCLLGDINGDAAVNSTDALFALQFSVNSITPTLLQEKLSDINCDGKINSTDALIILQYSVGKIDKFPKGISLVIY